MNGFGFKANTNLYQLKFFFTNDVESKVFNSNEGASLDPVMREIPDFKMIGAVEVNIREAEGNIFGIRFIDISGNKIQER